MLQKCCHFSTYSVYTIKHVASDEAYQYTIPHEHFALKVYQYIPVIFCSSGHHVFYKLNVHAVYKTYKKSYSRTENTVSKVTLGKLLRDVVEHIWAFPSA